MEEKILNARKNGMAVLLLTLLMPFFVLFR